MGYERLINKAKRSNKLSETLSRGNDQSIGFLFLFLVPIIGSRCLNSGDATGAARKEEKKKEGFCPTCIKHQLLSYHEKVTDSL